ncbi:Hypothetical predicted protein [Cloeon dipterum]|uniref:Uncharacterized protein n=1 Tax=Cloeon dipterum TaxID=197152 RepID=A0A8S1CZR2_9INSE|nr:Hypothetical predicted protein [Cloeon dipterum]
MNNSTGNIRFVSKDILFNTPKKTDVGPTKPPLEEPKKTRKYIKRKPKVEACTPIICKKVRANSRPQIRMNQPGFMNQYENGYASLRYNGLQYMHRHDIYQGQRIDTSQLKMPQNFYMNYHYSATNNQYYTPPHLPQYYPPCSPLLGSAMDINSHINVLRVMPEFGCIFEETEDYMKELERLLTIQLNEVAGDQIQTAPFWRNDELHEMLCSYELDSSSELTFCTGPVKEILETAYNYEELEKCLW